MPRKDARVTEWADSKSGERLVRSVGLNPTLSAFKFEIYYPFIFVRELS